MESLLDMRSQDSLNLNHAGQRNVFHVQVPHILHEEDMHVDTLTL